MNDQDKILAFLSEHGDSTSKQIADATDIFIVTVGMTLEQLEAKQLVRKVGRHWRKIADTVKRQGTNRRRQ